MTEETCKERLQVARLDRSQPPPGYEVDDYSDAEFHWSAPDEHYDLGLDEHCGSGTKAECMAAAWAHFEAEHDPPGMEVSRDDVGEAPSWLWYVSVDGAGGPIDGGELVHGTARVAAWAWYWRRVEVGDVLMRGPVSISERRATMPVPPRRAWPVCIAWSDAQVAAVERWLTEGGEPPEVLRG